MNASKTDLRQVDLGCGTAKQPGYIGIDRYPLPGVDLVCDLNNGIPLCSDTVDALLASHSLEHFRDLPAIAAEIFRVCKDRSVVTIIAPYSATRLNQANPYHVQGWNEHTARFFTTEYTPTVDRQDYDFPFASHWGLQGSDSTASDVDMRCLRMQFCYFPPYRHLGDDAKRVLRRSLSDVCDQIAIQLLVIKSPVDLAELTTRASALPAIEAPGFVARLREEELHGKPNLFAELAAIPDHLSGLIDGIAKRVDHLEQQLVAQAARSESEASRMDGIEREIVRETTALRANAGAAERLLTERLTATNSALTRQTMAAAEQAETAMRQEDLARREIQRLLVDDRRWKIEHPLRVVRAARKFVQRRRDFSAHLSWPAEAEKSPDGTTYLLQPGQFLGGGIHRTYSLHGNLEELRGLRVGTVSLFKPTPPALVGTYEVFDATGKTLRAGPVSFEPATRSLKCEFDSTLHPDQNQLGLTITPHFAVDELGIQPLEWQLLTAWTKRVRDIRLAWSPL